MKVRGYLFIELIMIMGIFSIIIFPLVMLMNKNINYITIIRNEYETEKFIGNLENIFIKLLKNPENQKKKYNLIQDEEGNFILKNDFGKEITKLRNIRINSDIKISLNKEKIFLEEDNLKKEFTKIFILEIKLENKIVKKVLLP